MENSLNFNNFQRLGMLLIVSGPSGTGKSTICHQIVKKDDNLFFSVSCTTRNPRPGEEDKKHYYFLSDNEFSEKIENNEFIEFAQVHKNQYGTLRDEVIKRITSGKDVVLDIDIQGAQMIKAVTKNDNLLKRCSEFVFISPPSFEELEQRLRGRGTETEQIIQIRLNTAKLELSKWREYEYIIVNNKIDQARKEFKKLITTLRNKTKRIIPIE